mmetsp:Transcript_1463/g.3253  ORF Transcript_1463/g.3253 Transcript_1463/m.3253 type:complete len:253 (+) Transcript_1463:1470-2228(+)
MPPPPSMTACLRGPSMSGRSTSIGTTAMSCARSTPSVAAPGPVVSSPRSLRSCSTKADDDSDSAAPMTTASSTVEILISSGLSMAGLASLTTCRMRLPMALFVGSSNAVNAKVVAITWNIPSPNANLKRLLSLSPSSSSPISKSRNCIPSSLSSVSSSSFWNTCSWSSTNPTRRNPSTGLMLRRLHSGTTPTVAARKTMVSLPSCATSSPDVTVSAAPAAAALLVVSFCRFRRRSFWCLLLLAVVAVVVAVV